MKLQLVPHTHVDIVWPKVGPMLARALDTEKSSHGECSIDQLRMLVTQDKSHLIVIVDEGEIVGAITVEFVNYPNKRIAMGTAFGGRGVANEEVDAQLKSWCRDMGASEYRMFCNESQMRLYSRFGFSKLYNVVGATL